MIFKRKIQNLKEKQIQISAEENFLNLKFFSKIISKIEHFVFFGTLLGLVRDGNLIEGDDDIDFYVNIHVMSYGLLAYLTLIKFTI